MKKFLFVLASLLAVAACDDGALTEVSSDEEAVTLSNSKSANSAARIKVMTRNMYVGADVDRIIEEQDVLQIPIRVAEAWATLQATDFPTRARTLAEEIAGEEPHLVGLQEVSIIRTQDVADFQLNAEDVAVDFLAQLQQELENLGAEYHLVDQVMNIDIELPRLTETGGLAEVRLTDYDAVLARDDVDVDEVNKGTYAAWFPVQGFEIRRGYVSLVATVADKEFRFVSTHLEPASTFNGYFQAEQAQELIAMLEAEQRPTILVGDLNTPAPGSPVYQAFLGAGFEDVWTQIGDSGDDGYTCCHLPNLSNPVVEFDERIDLILVRNVDDLKPQSAQLLGLAKLVGKYPDQRTSTGIWPSDHAGLTALLKFPNPGS